MRPLYKYLPSDFVPAVLERGELLFRNLTYFRQCEGKVRGDPYEGIHKDHPGTERVIRNLTKGFEMRDAFSFLNSTDSDLIFAFCLSERLDAQLALDFSANAIIEITNPAELIRRVSFKLQSLASTHRFGLLARPVIYYRPDEPALFDVAEPKNLAFVKNEHYHPQAEFRLAFGTRRAFKLIQQIGLPQHDPYNDALQKVPKERIVNIGRLSDIARLVSL